MCIEQCLSQCFTKQIDSYIDMKTKEKNLQHFVLNNLFRVISYNVQIKLLE